MATIRDIARLAGVSTATVSRAFAQPDRVRPVTREAVQSAARALGYAPDPTARSLARGRTQTLGLLVPDLANPVHARMVKTARQGALAAGYTLLVADRDDAQDSDTETAHALAQRTDGVTLLLPRMTDPEVQELARTKPVVTLNRVVPGIPGLTISSRDALECAVAHLADRGHRTVLNVLGSPGSIPGDERRDVVRESCARRGLRLLEVGPFPATLPRDGRLAAAVAEEVRGRGATAVIAFNDLQAIGLYRGLAADGILVGRDVALVGHDDVWMTDYLQPTLTSVRLPSEPATERAVAMLLAAIHARTQDHGAPVDPADTAPVETLECDLVIRDSTPPTAGTTSPERSTPS